MKPRSAPWRTVGSIPISVAIPQIMKEIMPQSRRAMLKGVPSKADIEILSKIGLHIVDDKCAPVGAGNLLERLWNLKACGTRRIGLAWAKGGVTSSRYSE